MTVCTRNETSPYIAQRALQASSTVQDGAIFSHLFVDLDQIIVSSPVYPVPVVAGCRHRRRSLCHHCSVHKMNGVGRATNSRFETVRLLHSPVQHLAASKVHDLVPLSVHH